MEFYCLSNGKFAPNYLINMDIRRTKVHANLFRVISEFLLMIFGLLIWRSTTATKDLNTQLKIKQELFSLQVKFVPSYINIFFYDFICNNNCISRWWHNMDSSLSNNNSLQVWHALVSIWWTNVCNQSDRLKTSKNYYCSKKRRMHTF